MSSITPIVFGTDGWRAVIADQFTDANVERVAQAYATFLLESGSAKPAVVVGYDNRFMADHFARLVANILDANDIRVQLFGEPIPTPLLSYAVVMQGLAGGVMVTASHNSAEYCGLKLKQSFGGSALEEVTNAVQALIDRDEPKHSPSSGIEAVPEGIRSGYREQLCELVDVDQIRSAGLKIIVDSMHGTGHRVIEEMLSGGTTECHTLRANRDVLFGGIAPEPIERNLKPLSDGTRNGGCIGVATDGDADRLGVMDEDGRFVTMHEVVPLLVLHLVRNKKMSGSVVATLTQSILTRRIAEALGLAYVETPVGFKYIAKLMLEGDVLIGAEESGGIGIKGHIPERDGILNALLVLEAVRYAGGNLAAALSAIHEEFGRFYYSRVDLHVVSAKGRSLIEELGKQTPAKIAGAKVTEVSRMDGIKFTIGDEAWLMLRQSGTEPVLRIYAESPSAGLTNQLLEEGRQMALQGMKDPSIKTI